MLSQLALIIIGAVAVFAQGAPSPETPAGEISDPEAYAVYAVVLPTLYSVKTAPGARVILQKETETVPRPGNGLQCPGPASAIPEGWRSVVDSYAAENARPRFVLSGQPLKLDYTVHPKAEIQINVRWDYVQVSAVGFNPSRTRAMVYMAYHCGMRCAGGTHYFLEKVDGAWRQVQGLGGCEWLA
ncbi:MAG TPA: hypothetical protein VFY29_14345 [Terriglobia bacterium]|nr:hypothetical protein [Terriglobia bacterium]